MITDLQRRLAPRKLHEAAYDDVTDNLCTSYSTKKSIIGTSVQFFFCKKKAGESIEDFSRELKHLVSQCDYDQTIILDRLLRDVFVAGLRSGPVMSAVMQSADTLSFNDAIDKAKMVHQIQQDAAELQSSITLKGPIHDSDLQSQLRCAARSRLRLLLMVYPHTQRPICSIFLS